MRRFIGEEGVLLTDLLIVIALLAMMTAAIFGVYQISQLTYTRATSLEDAQLGSRAGLDRMATELRLAGAFWNGAVGATAAITTATASSLTFLGDINSDTLDGSGNEITLTAAVASGATSITVNRATGADGSNAFAAGEYVYIADGARREVRQIAAGYTGGTAISLATALTNSYPAGSTVRSVESVTYTFNSGAGMLERSVGGGTAETIAENVTALTLGYFDSAGTSTTDLASIREIQISLTTQGSDGSRRTMTSRVRPRNLSIQ